MELPPPRLSPPLEPLTRARVGVDWLAVLAVGVATLVGRGAVCVVVTVFAFLGSAALAELFADGLAAFGSAFALSFGAGAGEADFLAGAGGVGAVAAGAVTAGAGAAGGGDEPCPGGVAGGP